MQLLRNIPGVLPQPCVATIGFFDGVHRGHRYLIEQVREVAVAHGFASGVVTFPVHPRKVVQPEYHPELLTTYEEKVALLAETGLDYCMTLLLKLPFFQQRSLCCSSTIIIIYVPLL